MDGKTLLDATKERLASRQETLQEVADGAGVGYQWLAKFSQNRIADPSVNKVQAVHDYFLRKQESARVS